VPLARDLHPEFGYVGSAPRLCRKLGLVLSFIVFGLVAGASGVAVFMANPDPDPMHAMALAPVEALIGATNFSVTATVETKGAQPPSAQKADKAGGIKSPCRENTAEQPGGDCTPARATKPRPVQAVNERPPIAAVPIGHRDGPAVLPTEPALPVAVAPGTLDGSATPADAAPAADDAPAPAESPAPKATPKKARKAQVHRRDRNEYSSSSHYSNHDFQNGYARVW
jgi:hypothetical protein